MRDFIAAQSRKFLALAGALDWLAPLAVRIVFGYFWAETGWAKLHNIAGATERFVEWGIPFPAFSAPFSAAWELIGGVLIMLGLLTRLTMVPMIINMVVALVLVVLPSVHGVDEFVELDEVLYILVFFWLLMAGPGRVSLDHLLFGRRPADPRVLAPQVH
jgi:putative oxidoreductase